MGILWPVSAAKWLADDYGKAQWEEVVMSFLFGSSEEREARKRQAAEEMEALRREVAAAMEARGKEEAEAEAKRKKIQARIKELEAEHSAHLEQASKLIGIVKPEVSLHAAKVAPKWEYLAENDASLDDLDSRGGQGWELVNVTSYETGAGGNLTVHMRYIFKRPVPRDEDLPESTQRKLKPVFELLDRGNEILAELEELNSQLKSI